MLFIVCLSTELCGGFGVILREAPSKVGALVIIGIGLVKGVEAAATGLINEAWVGIFVNVGGGRVDIVFILFILFRLLTWVC
jgi:hypothetical protein